MATTTSSWPTTPGRAPITPVWSAESITGPYVGIDGKDVTAGADAPPIVTHPYKFSKGYGWVGIAHCAIFDDGKDNWFYASTRPSA